MTDIIEEMARLDVPKEWIDSVNVDEILQRFRDAFSRLDDLKKFRSAHEQRNFLSRWWDNDKLESAQLSAQEIQAEFSKTIGQLMMISMLQAKRIESQQDQLVGQQAEIATLSGHIDRHTRALADEHARLFEQGEELKRLVRDALDIYYVQESERKIVEIASRVERSRHELVMAFDERLAAVSAVALQVKQATDATVTRVGEQFERRAARLDEDARRMLDTLTAQASDAASRSKQAFEHAERALTVGVNGRVQDLARELDTIGAGHAEDREATNALIGEFGARMSAMQAAHQEAERHLSRAVRRAHIAVAALGVVTAIAIGVVCAWLVRGPVPH